MIIPLIIATVFATGCAYLKSTTTSTTQTNGVTTVYTTVRAFSVLDANDNLTKFRNAGLSSTNGTFPPGTTIGSLNQSSTTSNVVAIVNAIATGVAAGLK